MILRDDVIPIGRLLKPYGIKGEITLLFDKPEFADIDTDYYFLEIEGIFVPFFLEEATFSSDMSARVKFEDVGDETQAAKLSRLPVFLLREAVEGLPAQDADDWDSLIGYTVEQLDGAVVGEIASVDSTTINVLFVVDTGRDELLIPATEDFIVAIDKDKKIIRMELPEGLIE